MGKKSQKIEKMRAACNLAMPGSVSQRAVSDFGPLLSILTPLWTTFLPPKIDSRKRPPKKPQNKPPENVFLDFGRFGSHFGGGALGGNSCFFLSFSPPGPQGRPKGTQGRPRPPNASKMGPHGSQNAPKCSHFGPLFGFLFSNVVSSCCFQGKVQKKNRRAFRPLFC